MAGKVETCGDSKAVLSYTLLSSNHPMVRTFRKCNMVIVRAWKDKNTILITIISTIYYSICFTCNVHVQSVHKGFTV